MGLEDGGQVPYGGNLCMSCHPRTMDIQKWHWEKLELFGMWVGYSKLQSDVFVVKDLE